MIGFCIPWIEDNVTRRKKRTYSNQHFRRYNCSGIILGVAVYNDNSNPIHFNNDKSIVSSMFYYWYNFKFICSFFRRYSFPTENNVCRFPENNVHAEFIWTIFFFFVQVPSIYCICLSIIIYFFMLYCIDVSKLLSYCLQLWIL